MCIKALINCRFRLKIHLSSPVNIRIKLSGHIKLKPYNNLGRMVIQSKLGQIIWSKKVILNYSCFALLFGTQMEPNQLKFYLFHLQNKHFFSFFTQNASLWTKKWLFVVLLYTTKLIIIHFLNQFQPNKTESCQIICLIWFVSKLDSAA